MLLVIPILSYFLNKTKLPLFKIVSNLQYNVLLIYQSIHLIVLSFKISYRSKNLRIIEVFPWKEKRILVNESIYIINSNLNRIKIKTLSKAFMILNLWTKTIQCLFPMWQLVISNNCSKIHGQKNVMKVHNNCHWNE